MSKPTPNDWSSSMVTYDTDGDDDDDDDDDQEDEQVGEADQNECEKLRFRMPDARGRMVNILEAAKNGDVAMLRQFCRIDASLVDAFDSEGYTALHRASYSNRLAAVRWLVRHGADIRARTDEGWEPVHSAAQWGHVLVLKTLLASGADINATTQGGNTPLHLACSRGLKNRAMIEYLLFRADLSTVSKSMPDAQRVLDTKLEPFEPGDVNLAIRNDANDTAFDICKRNCILYRLWEML